MTENGRPSRRDDDARGAVDERRAHARRRAARTSSRAPATARAPRTTTRSPAARARRRSAARRRGRARRRARRSRRRGRRRRRRRRPLAGGRGRRRAPVRPALHPAARPAGELPRRGRASARRSAAISSKGTANMSCSTNASRSAGVSVSSTTSSASPTESASSASCSGSAPSARLTIGSGTWTSSGSSRRVRARAQHVEAHAGDDRRQPAAQVLDVARVGAAEPQPGLLHGVVGLARASRASGRRPPAGGPGAPRTAPPASRCSSIWSHSFVVRRVRAIDRRTPSRCDEHRHHREERTMNARKKIAVAGATGRVGRHVVEVLERPRATTSSRCRGPRAWT